MVLDSATQEGLADGRTDKSEGSGRERPDLPRVPGSDQAQGQGPRPRRRPDARGLRLHASRILQPGAASKDAQLYLTRALARRSKENPQEPQPSSIWILPMHVRVGDRFTDEIRRPVRFAFRLDRLPTGLRVGPQPRTPGQRTVLEPVGRPPRLPEQRRPEQGQPCAEVSRRLLCRAGGPSRNLLRSVQGFPLLVRAQRQRAERHPGITQEVAPNESQRAPKPTP
jgi:hypothetical protein